MRQRTCFLLILSSLCFLVPVRQLSGQNADKLVKQAEKALTGYEYEKAQNYLKAALAEKPGHPEANYLLAKFHLKHGPVTDALPYMKKVMEANPEPSSEQWMDYGKALHVNNKFKEAKEAYDKSDPYRKNVREVAHLKLQCDYALKYVEKPMKVKIVNMSSVNSEMDEYMPFVSADQQRLFFTSRRKGSTGGKLAIDGQYYEDVWVSFNKGGQWTSPKRLDEPVNTAKHDACIGISPDGQTMYLYRGENGGDIYTTELKGDRWTKPKAFEYNTEHYESQVAVSPDNRNLYFVSDRLGNKDIFVCYRTASGSWSVPGRLGTVNTKHDDTSPFFHTDGKTFFFSSEGHSSMGGQDIFFVDCPNGRVPRGKVTNAGYPINTAADDMYFSMSPSGKYGYYSSNKKNSKGGHDLYMVILPDQKGPKLAILKGEVKEEFTGKPIEAKITITDNEKNEEVATFTSNSSTGEYVVALPSGKNYGITIEKDGHLFHSENIYLSGKEGYQELKKDIKLVNIQKGSKVVLKNIFFNTGSAEVLPASVSELKRLAALMDKNASLRIEVAGHTDNTGDAAANQGLSERRAMAVKSYLERLGVSAGRIVAKGYGETRPIASNATPEGRAQNRRTEFEIL